MEKKSALANDVSPSADEDKTLSEYITNLPPEQQALLKVGLYLMSQISILLIIG